MVCVPAASALVVMLAVPLLSTSVGPVPPSTVVVTVPVGAIVPDAGVTVTVNVTGSPAVCGFLLDVSVVVVAIGDEVVIVCVSVPLLDAKMLPAASGLYVTTIVCVPTPKVPGMKKSGVAFATPPVS